MTHDKFPDHNELTDDADIDIESKQDDADIDIAFKQKALFDNLAVTPGIKYVELEKSETASLIRPIGEQNGIEYWAILRVPKTKGHDSYLLLGKHPEKGYFLSIDASDNRQLDLSLEDTINPAKAPASIGDQPGTQLVVGRAGYIYKVPDHQPYDLDKNKYGAAIIESFGNQTSKTHFELTVTDGGINITDTSTNHTSLVYKDPVTT